MKLRTRTKVFALTAALVALNCAWLFHKGYFCTNLSCSRTYDPWVSEHYDASLPVFVTIADEADLIPYAKTQEQRRYLRLALKTLTENAQRFYAGHKLDRCAIIGNSPTILSTRSGVAIDGNDFVLRMNNAVVKGYEQDVGTKTSVHLFHSNFDTLTNANQADFVLVRVTYKRSPKYSKITAHLVMHLGAQLSSGKFDSRFIDYFPLNIAAHKDRLLILNPRLMEHVLKNWLPPGISREPSTGLYAIALGMHLCSSQLNLYAFGKNRFGTWDHYFSPHMRTTRVEMHDVDFEGQFINRLASKPGFTLTR